MVERRTRQTIRDVNDAASEDITVSDIWLKPTNASRQQGTADICT